MDLNLELTCCFCLNSSDLTSTLKPMDIDCGNQTTNLEHLILVSWLEVIQ